MKKLFLSLCIACGTLAAAELTNDITSEIPEIEFISHGFKKVANAAQNKTADWSQVVGIAKGISIRDAYKMASNDPSITYFFYTKGRTLVLEKEDGSYRRFHRGDTVFFSGEPSWGSTPGLADGYVRVQK